MGEVTLGVGEVALPRPTLGALALVGEVMLVTPLPLKPVFSVGVFLSASFGSEGALSGRTKTLSGGKTGLPGRGADAVLLEGTVCTGAALALVVVEGVAAVVEVVVVG